MAEGPTAEDKIAEMKATTAAAKGTDEVVVTDNKVAADIKVVSENKKVEDKVVEVELIPEEKKADSKVVDNKKAAEKADKTDKTDKVEEVKVASAEAVPAMAIPDIRVESVMLLDDRWAIPMDGLISVVTNPESSLEAIVTFTEVDCLDEQVDAGVIDPVSPVEPNSEVVGKSKDSIEPAQPVDPNKVEIFIPEDTNAFSICKILFENGIIDDVEKFHKYVQDKGKTTLLRNGNFSFDQGASYKTILAILSPDKLFPE